MYGGHDGVTLCPKEQPEMINTISGFLLESIVHLSVQVHRAPGVLSSQCRDGKAALLDFRPPPNSICQVDIAIASLKVFPSVLLPQLSARVEIILRSQVPR
jgi:hypothetical protein